MLGQISRTTCRLDFRKLLVIVETATCVIAYIAMTLVRDYSAYGPSFSRTTQLEQG